jgi:reactive intermediate/imine deaminase
MSTDDFDRSPRYLVPPTVAAPGGHYSHGTIAGGLLYVAGQLPVTPDGRKLTGAPFEEQARQVLANVQAVLDAAGSQVTDLVHVRVYVDDIANWPAFNAVYAQWAGDARPARAVVPTAPLHYGLKVEVEAVAVARR